MIRSCKRGVSLALFLCFLHLVASALKAEAGADLPSACQLDCETTFGLELGISPFGVEAYSNCSSLCVYPKPNFVDQIFTGIQWQCVEYARRWLLKNRGVVFGDVDIAADIWQLDYVIFPKTGHMREFVSIENGVIGRNVKYGDLLIYARSYLGTGHVAVVTHVNWQQQYLEVVEQNYKNEPWSDRYARRIEFIWSNDRLWLLDAHLIGWKRVVSRRTQK